MEGWIKLYRKLFDNPYYFSEKFCRGMAWVDMLLLANHAPGFFYKRGIRVDIQAGQLGYDIDSLAKRWKWSRNKVNRWLKDLENSKQIERQKTNVTTIISIVNYSIYQGNGIADERAYELPKGKAEGKAEGHKQEGIRRIKKVIGDFTTNSIEFYTIEATKAKGYPDDPKAVAYLEVARHICQKENGNWVLPYVLKIEKQISLDKFIKLYEKAGGDIQSITTKIDSIQDKIKYHDQYADLYSAINRWISNDNK